MKIYIAGPMRGKPDWNAAEFDRAAAAWTAMGWQVMSPAATSRAMGYRFGEDVVSAEHLRHVMAVDIACIYACDAIAVLPDWKQSLGASAEVAVARFIRLPIYDAMKPVVLPT